MIAVIQIGNSDDKLTQAEWAEFVENVRCILKGKCIETYFFAPSPGDKPWQNACWVVSVLEKDVEWLRLELVAARKKYKQDSVAVVLGDVRMW